MAGRKRASPKRSATPSPTSKSEILSRLARLRGELEERKLDAFYVVRPPNVHYLSGFAGHDTVLLVGRSSHVLITDFRYEEEAAKSASTFPAAIRKRTIAQEVANQIRKRRWRKIGFESNGMLIADRQELSAAFRDRGMKRIALCGVRGLIEALRAFKSPAEVAAIRRAIDVAERVGRAAARRLAPGRTELDIARFVARKTEDLGAEGVSFDVIAAYDAHASQPHARPGNTPARKGSVMLLDWGARVDSYCSDLTRLYTQHSIPPWLRNAHTKVLEAQRAAIECVGPGVTAREVDAAARNVLRKAGWGKLFGHGVGHGLGLEVHELPRVGPRSADVLRPGMVITVEPGVYFPGRGGIRIEDDVLVTETGAEVLSSLPRALD